MTPEREIEFLQRMEKVFAGSALGGAFPDVRFEAVRAASLPPGSAGAGMPPAIAPFSPPLRVRAGEEESFVVLPERDGGARDEAWREGTRNLDPEAPLFVRESPGRARDGRHYPDVSGVLLGENYYPVSYMKPEEGIAYVSLGVGAGNRASLVALRFSPAHPELMPDFSTPADVLRNSQRKFLAVDRKGSTGLAEFDLEAAKKDGALAAVGSVYSRENRTLYPGVARPGVPVVSFAPMLRGGRFPLPKILRSLLGALREEFPEPVAVEFAVVLGGKGPEEREHRFVAERVTPQWAEGEGAPEPLDLESLEGEVLCSSGSALGNGAFPGIRDIVYVGPDRFDVAESHEIGREVSDFNRRMVEAGRPYVLIGSGRWGTSDKWLGVPVAWEDVSGARLQVEVGLEGFNVESSRGTHFFRELTYHGVGVLHVGPGEPGDRIHWEYLNGRPPESEGKFVRHLSWKEPLRIRIDGRRGRAAVWKPEN